MPKVFTSEKQKIGELGENMAVKFLVKQGFKVLERNYTKKWGEIDIVAQKDSKLYFIEVKSVSSSFQAENSQYRAEDNMHPWKMQRLSRTIQTYLLEKDVDEDTEWQIDLLLVYLDLKANKCSIKLVNDLIL